MKSELINMPLMTPYEMELSLDRCEFEECVWVPDHSHTMPVLQNWQQ